MAQPTEPSPGKKKSDLSNNNYLRYSGLAFQLLASLLVAGWLGYKLDQYMGISFPAFMLLFGFLAFGGMMYQLYKSINSL